MKNTRIILAALSTMLALAATEASASTTVGYWRFEDQSTIGLDSSGNDLTLANQGSSGPVTQYTLPETGVGSDFYNPIPQTGAVNLDGATFSGTSHLARANSDGKFNLTSGSFTVEALVNVNAIGPATQYIASQWLSGANQRSWGFGLSGTGQVWLLVSEDGSDTKSINSGVTISAGDDYYLAASFDANNQTDGVTFYIYNLTDETNQTISASHTIDSLHNSSGPFEIGALAYGNRLAGVIDEVRLTDGVLSSSELLASIPESRSFTLLLSLGAITLLLVRYKKR